ncbi:hypothetical protein [Euzebya tangerina]|uniref:hypothetical protein n=1 Tax=Euzebya tangerina TaxID=591198 RepID=UPI000E3121B6|nr:hypothetical protein [Euzebya tangerina]
MTAPGPFSDIHDPIPRWDTQSDLLTSLAVHDLEQGGEVKPSCVAFQGEQAVFLTTLRPFTTGGHHRPVLEVLAVAAGLGADRLMISLAGRAWSLEDPIPPVSEDGDLRQPVLTIHSVDGSTTPPLSLNRLRAYDRTETGEVRLGEMICEVNALGFIPSALAVAASEATPVPVPGTDQAAALITQISRCERLGHRFAWSTDTAAYLDVLLDQFRGRGGDVEVQRCTG